MFIINGYWEVWFVPLDNEKEGCIDFVKVDTAPFILVLFVIYKVVIEPRNGFNTFEEVENTIMLVRRVDGIAI